MVKLNRLGACLGLNPLRNARHASNLPNSDCNMCKTTQRCMLFDMYNLDALCHYHYFHCNVREACSNEHDLPRSIKIIGEPGFINYPCPPFPMKYRFPQNINKLLWVNNLVLEYSLSCSQLTDQSNKTPTAS